MEMIIDESRLDSSTYRKIFEFIQREGIEPFERFVNDIYCINQSKLIENAVFCKKHPTLSLTRKNKVVIEFLEQFSNHFLYGNFSQPMGINSTGFREFILNTSKNMDKLNAYIENAKSLEELRVGRINFVNLKDHYLLRDSGFGRIQIWTESGNITTIRKNYTDGIITYFPIKDRDYDEKGYEEFGISISPNKDIKNSPTWLIQTENHKDGRQYRGAIIESFAINKEQLPTDEELSKYEEPQTLKLHKKQ